jgi:hypothetical protein
MILTPNSIDPSMLQEYQREESSNIANTTEKHKTKTNKS